MSKENQFFKGLQISLNQAASKSTLIIEKLKAGSSQFYSQIHEYLSQNNRIHAFNTLFNITSEVKRFDYIETVLLAGRFLLLNQLISECYIFLTMCQEKVEQIYGEPIDYTLVEEIGNMFYLSGQSDIAITWYEKLMEMNEAPESRMFFNIGMCYQLENNFPKAIESYVKSTYADPKFYKSWVNMGYCYLHDNKPDKALQSFQQLPLSGENLVCVGNAHFRQGNIEEAIAYYLRSAELKEDPGTYNNLGVALKKVGLLQDSISAFSDSLSLRPNSEAAINLITLYVELGKKSEAQQIFKMCLKAIPIEEHPNINKMLETIAAPSRRLSIFPKEAQGTVVNNILNKRRSTVHRASPVSNRLSGIKK
jgi:tetratricopeptide (TPR) repeat protein